MAAPKSKRKPRLNMAEVVAQLYLKPREAALVARGCYDCILDAMASGELPYAQLSPRKRVILREDLDEFIRRRMVTPR